jgi:23S rRNA (uracil1939-C5)-methyltransferase
VSDPASATTVEGAASARRVAEPAGEGAAPASVRAQTGAPARVQRGDELELEVQALAYGGEGVARVGDEGYVVFVAGAVPGDRVLAQVYERKRSYAHARAVQILRPSQERIPPRASHPGVAWQVLPYERQLEVKREQVEDALRRIGRLAGFELEPPLRAVQEWRYRNKLEYSFGHAPPGASAAPAGAEAPAGAGGLVCGFHAPARWNQVVHIDDCLLASELSNRARTAAYEWCREQGLRAWERSARPARGASAERATARSTRRGDADEERLARTGPGPDGRALLRNLVVREGRRTGMLQVRLVTTAGELDADGFARALVDGLGEAALSGVLWTRSRQLGETTAGGETELLWGEEELSERICGLDLRIPPEAFLQTNTEMAEALYGVAAEYAALGGSERVLDLYCGLGTIGLALARDAGQVWGLELSPEAVAGARAAALRNGVTNARFQAGEARRALEGLVAAAGRPDVLVVDPPRAGLGRRVTERVIAAAPGRIVYVSCNPTTLAADAALMVEAGWTLRRVRPVDMFPQTHHIECVALLERRDCA